MSMKTPLKQALGLGAGHSGTAHFIAQRFTALANIPLTIFLIWFVMTSLKLSHADFVARMHHPLTAILLLLTVLFFLWHMVMGMQVVIEDYIHKPLYKFSALIANKLIAIIALVCAFYAIFKLSFGV